MTEILEEGPLNPVQRASADSPTITKMNGYLHLPSNSRLPGTEFLGSRRAAFLDRDGVLVKDVHYLTDANQLKLLPGVVSGIRALQDHFFLIVATNQSGIARGFLTENDLMTIHVELVRMLADEGARLDALYYCPHLPEAVVTEYGTHCDCRKPKPAMLLRAADDWHIDPSQSFLVGDSLRDIEAAQNAGVKGIMLAEDARNGYEQMSVAHNLAVAAGMILGDSSPPDESSDRRGPPMEATL